MGVGGKLLSGDHERLMGDHERLKLFFRDYVRRGG